MTLQERTPVPILQNEWEFEKLLEIYEKLDPQAVLEIGSFFGGTLYYWLNLGSPQIMTCVDLPIESNDGRYQQMLESRKLWDQWIKNSGTYNFKFHDIKGDSTSLYVINKVYNLNPHGIDFLFIDGDHSYEGVKADYDNYFSLVRPGGVIVFHDIVGYWTVKKFWDEIKIGKKYTEICNSGPDGWGLGLLYI